MSSGCQKLRLAFRSTSASLGSFESRSWLSQLARVDKPIPTSSAISHRARPLVSVSRTALRQNSCVGLFPLPIAHLLVPHLVLSTFPGQLQDPVFTPDTPAYGVEVARRNTFDTRSRSKLISIADASLNLAQRPRRTPFVNTI